MKKATKFDFKTLLVLSLSLLLCLSVAFTAACSEESTSSSSSSSVKEEEVYPTDAQTVTNGDFEFSTFTKKDTDFPVSSSMGWVRSSDSITTSANSSSYSSGIINTEDEAYNAIAGKAGFDTVSEGVYYNPRTPYYYGLVENSYEYSEETENEDGLPMTGTKLLMIHNEVTSNPGEGTAQKFTSNTSLSLGRHEYGKISVWVLTHDLKSAIDGVDFGAYIAVQNTLSSSVSPLVIKNINTEDNWVKYTVYVAPSDFTTSSFKVVLGLGFGSSKIRREYVEGFAYFDNVTFEVINKEEYQAGIATVATDDQYNLNKFDASEKTYSLVEANELISNEANQNYTETKGYTKANEYTAANAYTERVLSLSHARTQSEQVTISGTSEKNTFINLSNQADGTVATGDIADALTAANAYLAANGKDAIEAPFANVNALYFVHNDPTSYSFTTNSFPVEEGSYLKLSLWVNVGVAYPTDTALTITVNDLGLGSNDEVATVVATSIHTMNDENENYNNWREYVLFISNTLNSNDVENDETRYFNVKFDFGATGKSVSDGTWGLTSGYAIVANLNGYLLSESDYSKGDVSNYSYAKKVSLAADLPNGVDGSEENDSYTFTYSSNDNVAVKTGVATNVIGYTGVVANSKAVGGTEDSVYSDDKVLAGILNSEYDYSNILSAAEINALNSLGKANDNKYLQPLMIKNLENRAYGFVGSSATLAANTTTYVTLKVKAIGDAAANIYLVNADALEGFKVLQVAAKDYTFENDTLTVLDTYKVDKDLVISVNAYDCANDALTEDGWFTVRFVIVTGNQAYTYRPEFWNGTRDGQVTCSGTVFFDSYTVTTAKSLNDIKNELEIDYNEQPVETTYNRIPTYIQYTDEDGNDAVKYKTYSEASVVYASYANCKAVIADYTVLDAVHEEDNRNSGTTDEEEQTSSSTSEEETSFSWALQITSIIIAAVLIVLLLIVAGKVLWDKFGKKKKASVSYYNRDSRDAAGKKIEAKKAKKTATAEETTEETAEEVEAPVEEVKPYDYDNMENNIESEEAVEETAEETTETTEETEGENN